MTVIAVIDHGAGNLVSIARGLERVGATAVVASEPESLAEADGIVLPGVGTTSSVMAGIRSAGFEEALSHPGVPVFGICVGMQVLFGFSAEDGARCLGLIPGTVERLTDAPSLPHIGWNELDVSDDPLFAGLPPRPEVYFVHSFAPVPEDDTAVIATASHGGRFVAAVRHGRVSGTQFHPERSGPTGLRILGNFVASTAGVAA